MQYLLMSAAGHQASPPGSYCQDMPPRSAASSFPPHLPPLLQQTALNEDLPSLVGIAFIDTCTSSTWRTALS